MKNCRIEENGQLAPNSVPHFTKSLIVSIFWLANFPSHPSTYFIKSFGGNRYFNKNHFKIYLQKTVNVLENSIYYMIICKISDV